MVISDGGEENKKKKKYDWERNNVLPLMAMMMMEGMNVGLNTLFKAATLKGMSYHVFVAYAYAVAAALLLPAPFFSHRSTLLPPLNFSIMIKIAFLGIIGCCSQIMGFTGISYSSPTLASAISNLVPAFTFVLAIIFRMEKVAMKSKSSQAKVLGTIISISGAFVATLYRGPPVIMPLSSNGPNFHDHQIILQNPNTNSSWVIGGFLLTAEYILVPLWYILQTQIMKEYPNELTVIFFYNLIVSIMAAIVGLVVETNSNAWKLRPKIALASVLCSGVFGSFVSNTVHTWALRLKGPVYVAMFKPLSIAIAVVMGFAFLGETLHLGSLIGATIISIGFYTVMWGKSKEEIIEESRIESGQDQQSLPTHRTPLLQKYKTETR